MEGKKAVVAAVVAEVGVFGAGVGEVSGFSCCCCCCCCCCCGSRASLRDVRADSAWEAGSEVASLGLRVVWRL